MTVFRYARFDAEGRCVGITESPVELHGALLVDAGVAPNDLWSVNGAIVPRTKISLQSDRKVFLCDGADRPHITPEGLGIVFSVDGIVGGELARETPGVVTVEALGGYWSEPLVLRFDTLENLKAEAAAKIDTAAGVERIQHITDQPGQAAVYAAKLAEAQAWPDGPQAYVHSAEEAAEIVARAAACDAALAEIEARRLADKRAISAATTVLELWEAGYVE